MELKEKSNLIYLFGSVMEVRFKHSTGHDNLLIDIRHMPIQSLKKLSSMEPEMLDKIVEYIQECYRNVVLECAITIRTDVELDSNIIPWEDIFPEGTIESIINHVRRSVAKLVMV